VGQTPPAVGQTRLRRQIGAVLCPFAPEKRRDAQIDLNLDPKGSGAGASGAQTVYD